MRITKIRLHTLLAAVFLSLFLTAITAFAGQHQSAESHPLRQIEISGIAIATPSGKISDILEAQGYTRVSGTMYTKQEQLQNQRKTIFRIEVEDTAAFREITYHRSLSGGRVKTAGDPEPVPDYEVDMAQRFYALMCEDVSEAIMEERQCEPLTKVTINAGHGQFIQINDSISMQLNVTAANSAVGIKYRY